MTTISPGSRGVLAVALLICSNLFMTCAWYLHLKMPQWGMGKAVVLSWLLAFFEYCLQVPANRLGHAGQGGPFRAPQLKIIQEAISMSAFGAFSTWVLRERLRWTDVLAFALIFSGVAVGILGKQPSVQADYHHAAGDVQLPPAPTPAPPGRGLRQTLVELLPFKLTQQQLPQPWGGAGSSEAAVVKYAHIATSDELERVHTQVLQAEGFEAHAAATSEQQELHHRDVTHSSGGSIAGGASGSPGGLAT